MFNIFKKKTIPTTNLSWLHTDIHSHLIPGIDDGVPDAATSVQFIKALMGLGLEQFIMTPHIYDEVHPNTPQTINAAHEVLYKEMQREGLADVYTHSAAEYMLSEQFSGLLAQKEMKAFPDKYLLVEMSWLSEPLKLEELIFQIQTHGYKPIMAHPERYVFYFDNPAAYHKLKEMGCLLQLNLLSPTGYYGKGVEKATAYLIKHKLYDLAGTDLHHERHLSKLTRYVRSGQAYRDLGHLDLKNKELFGQ